ncbi:YaeQ family protein [Dyella terrae]|uniref:YaeQ family protein n=1 Tax=Dyella terrae TaxID=522259 RepID=UPI001EFC45DE|nr:YaeQ family protein [Dyella terrae]ULU23887.1 YaeQ family protein [Dyella terrae]
MALNATIYKVELQISNMDRHYYATHALTLARHPSETEARLMVRLLAFALYADEIEQWIEVGQPDEARIRKACGRARQVAVINYGGRSADIWWNKAASSLGRSKNLAVLDIPEATVQQLTTLLNRGMRLQCLIQDGEIQLMDGETTVTVQPLARLGEYAAA